MPFAFPRIPEQPSMGETYTPTERLALTADDRVVPYGSPDASSLFCIPGRPIPIELAQKYGLVESVSEVKESAPAETKELKPAATKKRAARPPGQGGRK